MRLSRLFTKTSKNVPADETAKNAQLLIQAGYVHKEMAGVYTFLPLGLEVLNNIANIIRDEMDAIGGQEILMPALQIKERYETTGRWDDKVVDDWFKTKLVNGTEVGLGFSHEENLTPLIKNFNISYKDLPIAPYQVQTKFRNELRSKSGLMRGREFLMKDMYSFALNDDQHKEFYTKAQGAYEKVFQRLGIGDKTFMTFASGGSFSKFSHEFQTITDAGEDTIYLSREKKIAVNKEVFNDDVLAELQLDRGELEEVRAIEIGNIFNLGTKFSEPFDLTVSDETGRKISIIMGCYGIGVSRLMGALAEVLSDDKGLVWPESVAPAKVYLARLSESEEAVKNADELYDRLTASGTTVLYDDRDVRAGQKFADADLLGIPYRIVISDKTVAVNQYELKSRQSDEVQQVSLEDVLKQLGISK